MKKTVTMSVHEKGYYETNTIIAKAWRGHSNSKDKDKDNHRNNDDANQKQLQHDMKSCFDGYIGR